MTSGARQAFAVVDMAALARLLCAELAATGWAVKRAGDALRLSDGRFTEPVNLLRTAVRMVLSRSTVAEAAGAVAKETRGNLARASRFFRRFADRFASHAAAVLDHYFVAYPRASCAAVGWDYWELRGLNRLAAEEVFEQGMQEFESFLKIAEQDRLPELSACRRAGVT